MSSMSAFVRTLDKNLEVCYYPDPKRWNSFYVGKGNPILNVANWSKEIPFLKCDGTLSDEIKSIPNNSGGIYMFFLKGINIPFSENYILYIGRVQYTKSQNIRKRAREYGDPKYRDTRPNIKNMFSYWANSLYYRYYLEKDNDQIKKMNRY